MSKEQLQTNNVGLNANNVDLNDILNLVRTKLISLAGITVTAETLLEGITARDAAGNLIMGTMPHPVDGVEITIIEMFEKFQPTSTVQNGNVITATDGSGNKKVSTLASGGTMTEVYTASDGFTITRTSVVNGNRKFTDTYVGSDGSRMTKVTTIDSNGNASYTYN